MPFLFKNYSGDSIYAPRGLAYTPLPFRPFSHPFKQKGGADRWQGVKPGYVLWDTGAIFLKKYYIIFCDCNMWELRQQIHI